MDGLNVALGETNLNMTANVTDDTTLGVGDNFLTFLDENSSVVFKGVIDPNGTFLIDPSQFVNILLDQPQIHTQRFLDTSNHVTHQMIQMSPAFSLVGGKSDSQDYNGSNITKFYQIQDCVPPSTTTESHSYTQPTVDSVLHPVILKPQSSEITQLTLPKPASTSIVVDVKIPESRDSTGSKPAQSFVCCVCSEVFSGYQQLRKHRATHVDEKPFRCQQCDMAFNFEMNLNLHKILHEVEESGNLQCKVCLAKFSRLASLKSHLRTHEKEENLLCNECGEEVPTLAKLNDHMEEHNTRVQQCMVYRCKLCGKAFNSQALLRDHSKGHAEVRKELRSFARQKPRPKVKPKNSETSSWISNKSKQKMKRVCSVCSKSFDKPSQLERHFRVHSGAKPFKCSYPDCNKCFNQKVTLESHVLACHQRLKPFKCHMCNICFSQRGNLKSHIVKVHIPSGENDKVYKCEECACVYRRLATLNHHIARVHSVISTTEVTSQVHLNQEIPTNNSTIPTSQLSDSEVVETVIHVNPNQMVTSEQQQHQSSSDQPLLVEEDVTSSKGLEYSNEETIHEVNCVYGDSLGAPKRCLLKVKKVGQKKYHLCPVCPKSFRKPSDLIRHIRVHTQERPYTCNICSKSFAVKSTLNTHMKTHDLVKRLSCTVCQKKFSVLSSLKSHERLHTGVKPFQCMQCGKQFRTSTQRRVHQKTHTRNALGLTGRRKLTRIGEPKPTVTLSDPLKITSGGLVPVPNRIGRNVNGLSDEIPRPYRCTQANCISSFKKSSHLKQHLLSHSGERPYKCLQCNRNFITSGVLKNHIKTHEGVRAFSCDKCHVAFTTNGSLKRHMATHIHERLYVCPYCARTFKTSVATRKHIKVHRNETNKPLCTTLADLANHANGVMLINQLPPANATATSSSEYSQQLTDSQICDTSDLNAIYGNDFSEINQVLASQLNMEAQEENHLPLDGDPALEVEVPCSSDTSIVHCHDSVILHHASNNILEYTLLAQTIDSSQGDATENLVLPLDQVSTFDPSIFTLQLQQGESLDLQFLQDAQGIENDTDSCLNESVSYEYASTSIEQEQETETPDVAEHPNPSITLEENEGFDLQSPPPVTTETLVKPMVNKKKSSTSTKPQPQIKSPKPMKEEDSVDVRNLKEVTRPISVQLYTELATVPYQRRFTGLWTKQETVGNKDCPICSTKFKKKSDLDRHYLIHTGEKPYRCSVCGKSFRVKSTRQAHMRTHDEKKKTVACHLCSNLFSTKSSLRVHLRCHLNLKPYPCPFPNCSRQFRTSGHRKSHIQSHFKEAKKRKVEIGDDYSKPSGSVCLPSVESIKDNKKNSDINLQLEQLEQRVQSMLETPAATITVPENSHLVGGVELQFDGVHFTSLDMNSLQVDESFLQNVANVIFIP